jgi:NhaC family Na+:H+ antiporter
MAPLIGADPVITAGAVISGAYFGDKMTPLSETTVLVPQLVGRGLTVSRHVRNMFWTAGPALVLSLVVFFVLGAMADPQGGIATDEARAVLAEAFDISFVALLPLVLLVGFAALRFPPFLAILGSAVFAGLLAPFIQPQAVEAFVEDPDGGPVAVGVEALFAAMASGFRSHSGVEAVDQLFSRGGMAGMLTTVWLILGALSFAAVMEHAGFLERLLRPIVSRTRSRGSLILATTGSGIGLNVVAGDQYVADVLPARMFRDEYARRGLAPQVLSRTVEDAGTATSVLVPWNTCGAYVAGVLGVSTAAYLPYCVFNIASPVLSVLYGYLGFQTPSVSGGQDDGPDSDPGVGPAAESADRAEHTAAGHGSDA